MPTGRHNRLHAGRRPTLFHELHADSGRYVAGREQSGVGIVADCAARIDIRSVNCMNKRLNDFFWLVGPSVMVIAYIAAIIAGIGDK